MLRDSTSLLGAASAMSHASRWTIHAARVAMVAAIAGAPGSAFAAKAGASTVVNLVTWDGNALVEQHPELLGVVARTGQPPLTDDGLVELARGGFDADAIARIVQERRCACDVSPAGLVRLRKAGVPPPVLQAVSAHALPPNREIALRITLDFEGKSREARKSYLYAIVRDGKRDRVLFTDLNTLLAGRWKADTLVDRTDAVLTRTMRRIAFEGVLPLKTAGARDVWVFASSKPDIRHPEEIPPAERAGVRRFQIDYPASSVQRRCDLAMHFKEDVALAGKWQGDRADFECEWE